MTHHLEWTNSLRTHETRVADDFHKATQRGELYYFAELLSREKDKNESPAILQHLYVGNKIHKTFEQLQDEHKENLEKMKEKFGASAVAGAEPFNPFVGGAFDEGGSDDDEKQHNLVFSSGNYKYSQRLVNPPEKGKAKRLRSLPSKAYNNHFLWSSKSIALEEGLRQITILNDLSFDKLMQTFDKLQSGEPIAFMDVFWASKTGNARFFGLHPNAKDSLGRLSNFTESMTRFDGALTKETYREIELDALVLTTVNDYAQHLKLIKNNVLLTKYSVFPPLRHSDRDGECKVDALLVGHTVEGFVHTRPLCTSADLSLAMYELMDPKSFRAGFIHMPQLLPHQFERHTEGFYRFHFRTPFATSSWQYVKCVIPSNVRELRPYLSGIYFSDTNVKENNYVPIAKTVKTCPGNQFFVGESVSAACIPAALTSFAQQVCIAVSQCWNLDEIVVSMCVDIETCRDYRDGKRHGFVVAPHMAAPGELEHYRYRVRHLHSFRTKERVAGNRRNALIGLDGLSTRYLKDFNKYYHEEARALASKLPRDHIDTSTVSSVRLAAMELARQHFLADLHVAAESESSGCESEEKGEGDDVLGYMCDTSHATTALHRMGTAPVPDRPQGSARVDSPLSEASTEDAAKPAAALRKRDREHRPSVLMLERHRKMMLKDLASPLKETAPKHSKSPVKELKQFRLDESRPSTSASTATLKSDYHHSRRPTKLTSAPPLGPGLPSAEEIEMERQTRYRRSMDEALEEYLIAYPKLFPSTRHTLCEHNTAAPYLGSPRASKVLMRKRASRSVPVSPAPTLAIQLRRSEDDSDDPELDEAFFRDLLLEKKIDELAATVDVQDLFGDLDVRAEVRRLYESEPRYSVDNCSATEKLSERSPRYYQEHDPERKRAFDLLVDGIGGKAAARIREIENYERLKEYVRRRRQQEQLSMKQVQGLHILHHFNKPHEYSSSSDEENEEDLAMNALLGTCLDAPSEQPAVEETPKEEKAQTVERAFRPKSADDVPMNADLYRRLSVRLSANRTTLSEGSPRRESKAVIKRSRNSIFMSVNNVLLDGRMVQEVAKLKPGEAIEDIHWETMTDSLSTVLHDPDEAESQSDAVHILSPVREGSPTGGRFWGVNKDAVVVRRISQSSEAATGSDPTESLLESSQGTWEGSDEPCSSAASAIVDASAAVSDSSAAPVVGADDGLAPREQYNSCPETPVEVLPGSLVVPIAGRPATAEQSNVPLPPEFAIEVAISNCTPSHELMHSLALLATQTEAASKRILTPVVTTAEVLNLHSESAPPVEITAARVTSPIAQRVTTVDGALVASGGVLEEDDAPAAELSEPSSLPVSSERRRRRSSRSRSGSPERSRRPTTNPVAPTIAEQSVVEDLTADGHANRAPIACNAPQVPSLVEGPDAGLKVEDLSLLLLAVTSARLTAPGGDPFLQARPKPLPPNKPSVSTAAKLQSSPAARRHYVNPMAPSLKHPKPQLKPPSVVDDVDTERARAVRLGVKGLGYDGAPPARNPAQHTSLAGTPSDLSHRSHSTGALHGAASHSVQDRRSFDSTMDMPASPKSPRTPNSPKSPKSPKSPVMILRSRSSSPELIVSPAEHSRALHKSIMDLDAKQSVLDQSLALMFDEPQLTSSVSTGADTFSALLPRLTFDPPEISILEASVAELSVEGTAGFEPIVFVDSMPNTPMPSVEGSAQDLGSLLDVTTSLVPSLSPLQESLQEASTVLLTPTEPTAIPHPMQTAQRRSILSPNRRNRKVKPTAPRRPVLIVRPSSRSPEPIIQYSCDDRGDGECYSGDDEPAKALQVTSPAVVRKPMRLIHGDRHRESPRAAGQLDFSGAPANVLEAIQTATHGALQLPPALRFPAIPFTK